MRKLIRNHRYEFKYPYYVEENGKVWSERTHKYMAISLDRYGYEKVCLMAKDGHRHRFSVHRLVLENFCPRDDMADLQVNHKDGNKRNNNLDNLEWCTCQENIDHAVKMNLRADQRGENNPYHKITEQQAKEIIDLLLSKKYTQLEISRMYGLSDDYAGNIKRKKLWKYFTKDIDFS